MNKRMMSVLCVALLGVTLGVDAGSACSTANPVAAGYDQKKLNNDLWFHMTGTTEYRHYPELKSTEDLLACGANPNLTFNKPSLFQKTVCGAIDLCESTTILIMAAERGDVSAVKALLVGGARVNTTVWNIKATALTEAVEHPEIVQVLLEHGANPNGFSSYRRPLHKALGFWGSDDETVRLLLEHGADVHMKNGDGKTPLAHALDIRNQKQREKCIALLMSHGASVEESLVG